ncbi:hypothetical protein [Leptospira kmetyi]|uniref:Transcriptional antiterminator, Rof n=1 Tax=Leptospira kmetyi TaxID=408139 RepID=A0A2M9XMV3_9LEPT|nr:hypothetical protein [Leptospira kmetyi]AYV55239.1 hypothetical protein EFP84_06755 [Leptospira kmetyi]EQA51842.1 hypothetical protein LEP1GSC052_2705 [Leptospira kmetyi serovar Malaysia str. Bejo-Iso9]PJZ28960.1 hypothetical protein CH378_15030 [Leptospira kmetyi]PJZ40632.1 hypothetical protein CH370_15030 [Leptospira kmetyi]TGL70440.1 hypothetical protein EHQ67_06560 [Leptospira kmetyi]
MNVYVPVACDFYDRLEEIVLRKRKVSLEWIGENETQPVRTPKIRILDLVSANREEFAVLEGGEKIRLDKILKIES